MKKLLRALMQRRCAAVYGHLVCQEEPGHAGAHVDRVGRNRWRVCW